MTSCWRCGAEVAAGRVGVRDVCGKCQSYLHCCRSCGFYEPGAHNDCREPNAEMVADKEQANFCDFFRLATLPPEAATTKRDDARGQLEKLFRK